MRRRKSKGSQYNVQPKNLKSLTKQMLEPRNLLLYKGS